MKKAAVQLSMNFLVILIMCLVILGVGISIFYKLYSDAEDYIKKVDDIHQRQLDQHLVGSGRIAIAESSKNVQNGKFTTFFMGVKNVLDEENYFGIKVRYSGTTTANGVTGADFPRINSWVANPYQALKIGTNSRAYASIGIKPENAPRGQYVFDVDVCYANTENDAKAFNSNCTAYPPPLQIYVNVV